MIYQAQKKDIPAAAGMAALLFEGSPEEELVRELDALIASGTCAVFLASEDGQLTGFAQCQLRHDYVEGTHSSPVGYLEGIFVRPEYRHQGRARALLEACQQWAKDQSCTEFASDCGLDNHGSLAFHLKTGFMEANRIICFTKKI